MSHDISKLTFDEITIGYVKEFQIIVTESLVANFAKLSGDFNPIHMNEDYAKSTKFKRRVVHGMFLASFLSRMVGMHLPGKNALYVSQSLEFPNPCFISRSRIILMISGVSFRRELRRRLMRHFFSF